MPSSAGLGRLGPSRVTINHKERSISLCHRVSVSLTSFCAAHSLVMQRVADRRMLGSTDFLDNRRKSRAISGVPSADWIC
jgi:hypothetical protein